MFLLNALLLVMSAQSAEIAKKQICQPEMSEQKCDEAICYAEMSTYLREYGERYDKWYDELGLNADIFFDHPKSYGRNKAVTPNLIDVRYTIALRRFGGWAFAVNMVCADRKWERQLFDPKKCGPVLRIASYRTIDEGLKPEDLDAMPKTREGMASWLQRSLKWQEADLRQCNGAVEHLAAFSGRQSQFWHDGYRDWLKGVEPTKDKNISITLDGDAYFIRATGRADPSSGRMESGSHNLEISEANGGVNYDWAKRMYEIVRPCLKQSNAPPPWKKGLGEGYSDSE